MGVLPLLAYLLLLTGAQALYPSGPRLDQELPRGDEVSQEVQLAVPIKFYGQTLQSIYVNGNGLLSFLTEIPRFFNEPFPLEYPVVAPFYSNVDTSSTGTVYYRESREQEVLSTIASKVANLYPSIPDFRPLAAFIATWDRVGYFEGKSDKVNTYQAVIASDGSESFVELLYPNNGITWIRAESGKSSRPDARGQAGLSSPGGKLAVLKGSGTDRVYNLPRWTNTLTPGEYMFRVGNIEETGIPEPPQRAIQNEEEEHDEPQTCSDGAHLCHKSSDCFDQPEGGFCCRCQKRYFGDGKNCLDYEAHRMIGRVNISLNGVESQNLNMQAFIVTGDGRTYTAISGVPQYIGYNMQLLVSLGSFVGFLFAKPIGDAPNGYQLTGGVVNHTVDISFGSQHHVTINQRYTGLDLFEQVKMEAEVTGTIPPVAPGAKLGVLDFQEQFTRIGPGLFRSQSRHNVEYLDNSKETYDINVDQTIQFTEYCPSAYKGLSSLRLKSSRNFLKYEPKDMILRLASTNKVSQNADGHDPCTEGHVTCVANSTCLVEEDSFRCVCNTGFQTLPEQTSDFGCVDINECEDGSGNCDSKALCVNEVGTYSCQCFPGYIGDGRHCEALEQPKTPTLSNGVCRGYGDRLSCNCDDGFEKIPDTSEIGFKCEDIDECYVSISCDQNAECINSFGSFNCRCLPGYVGDGFSCNEDEGSCQNMDCPDGTLCRETRDGPECVCSPGYVGTVPHCRPQDACQTDSDCRENNVCMWNSTLGYSACTCREGYIQDEKSCLPPANEHALVRTCMRGECRCPHGYEDNGQFCVPSTTAAPSTYRQTSCKNQENCHENAKCIYVHDKKDYECKCNPGFEGDGYSCTEFEMSCNQISICDINAGCHYDSSSERYICICNEGYQGDGTTCYPIIEEQCPTCHLYGICISGSCSCIEGYVGDGIVYCEKEVPDCDTLGNCDPNADCLYDTMEQGHRCKCRTGYEGDGYTCNELITCHEHTEICSQDATCTISYETYTYSCQCNEGFFGNGSHCKEINRQEEEFLLLNKGMATIQLPFQPAGNNIGRPIQINGNQRAIGIAVDCIEGRVYWSDILNQKIKSSKYDGGDVQDFIVSGVKSPEGLAIDWINRVLYWTDSGLHVIASAKLDDRKIVNIISNGLVNPRGIAVHPYLRKIFWSDWYRKNPVIEIADLDGRNREVLVQNPNVKLANSLAIDWNSNETCWADAGLKTIECIDFYQRIQRSVVQNCTYPFGLAITPDAYYWTDWYTGKVESSKKGSGKLTKSIPLPIGGDDKLYGLAAVTSFCPR